MSSRDDTIAARATPPGRGAVAIVRLSGPRAAEIGRAITGRALEPRRAELCAFRGTDGSRIDHGLALYFPGPRSYTGEDVVELHGHGGAVVSEWLLATAYALGARAAEPGEFTLRAFLNDKLDLTQAEAVADLVDSGSRLAARAALRSLTGRFSERVQRVQEGLTGVRVHVEAWLDFPDEDIERAALDALAARLEALERQLRDLTREARGGALLRDGLHVVIAGPPNAGKSSLMNRLAGYDAAIVTPVPGTTRDPLREHLSLDGLPVSLVDTAGLREAADVVEQEGVRRAQRELDRADHALWVMDVREDAARGLAAARAALGAATPFSLLLNKVDLITEGAGRHERAGVTMIRLSALTGEGIDLVIEHLKGLAGWSSEVAGSFSARARHLDALERAAAAISRARVQLPEVLELAAEDLKAAQTALSELTGEVASDDLLGEIFASFCIGK